jgi:hypothetical protein
VNASSVHFSNTFSSIFLPHHIESAVISDFLKQIYVSEGNYRKVCHEGKYLCEENVFQLTRRSTGSSLMHMSDALEVPACHDKVLCLGEKGAGVSPCVRSDIACE